ncbi:uncharacterized protein LOC111014780 [Momordica charantia]|uniref:Uncharacterized protein LOC111014780 n=1 Tax=Momordica charantia TaxID=3673 RepID=A0A6J1CW64_MOMCH|nr:uncharacterized protein LOC111014780 [Momordica charantia]
MAEKKSPLMPRLKKAVRKITALLRLNLSLCLARRRPSGRLRSFSFSDRTVGLRSFLEDEEIGENCSMRRLERASSLRYGNAEDDVDKRSQIFIDNFLRRLRLERQISLQLRYYRINSSGTEDEERSPPPPPCSSIQ